MERKFEQDCEDAILASRELGINEDMLFWHLRNGIHDSFFDGSMVMLSWSVPEEKWALKFLIDRGMIFFLNNRYYTTPYGWYAYKRMCEICFAKLSKLDKYIKIKRFLQNLFHPIKSLRRAFK